MAQRPKVGLGLRYKKTALVSVLRAFFPVMYKFTPNAANFKVAFHSAGASPDSLPAVPGAAGGGDLQRQLTDLGP